MSKRLLGQFDEPYGLHVKDRDQNGTKLRGSARRRGSHHKGPVVMRSAASRKSSALREYPVELQKTTTGVVGFSRRITHGERRFVFGTGSRNI
jgi:hypothetical protein